MLNELGWTLTNQYNEYTHSVSNIDHVEEELDELACTNYPVTDSLYALDINQITVQNAELTETVHQHLHSYKEVLAQNE